MLKTHVTLDFYKADSEILAKSEALKVAIEAAVKTLNLKISNDNYIQFQPQGVTATVITDAFIFSIHTWPEHESCAIDLYTARDYNFAGEVAQALKHELKAQEYDLKVLDRTKSIR